MTAIKPVGKLFTGCIQINSMALMYRGNHYQLHKGARDTIHIFQQSIALYVLTINKSLGYMGLNSYMSPVPDAINTIFLHTQGEIASHLGEGWEELEPETIVEKLIDYLM